MIPILVVGTIIAVVLAQMGRSEKRKLRRRIEASGCMLCIRCGYDLRGSAEQGRCPECGAAYEEESVKAAWKEYLWEL